MARGFFPSSTLTARKAPVSMVPKCGSCGLYQTCLSPKMEPSGKGRRRILIVAETPGADEDERGIQFVGVSGQLLEETLASVGVKMREDCKLTNALICRPPNNDITDDQMVDYCRPNLVKTLNEFKPEIIVPMGGTAVQSLLGHIYKDDDLGEISRWAGWQIPCQRLNAWVCPTFHPSYVMRTERPREGSATNPVPRMVFRRHLKEMAALEGRPWNNVPDYKSQVERFLKPSEAAKAIRTFLTSALIAFDYETTTLKPEYEGAAIVCCSISNGKRTIAYPWLGEAIEATQEALRSESGKIAANLKFEERWTRWFFGHGVTNWNWDTVVAAHCIDNRPNITSIKFQAFVLLGAEAYDEHVKKFLKAKGQATNQIKQEVELDQLLVYNGLDSLLEFKVAKIQQNWINGYRKEN